NAETNPDGLFQWSELCRYRCAPGLQQRRITESRPCVSATPAGAHSGMNSLQHKDDYFIAEYTLGLLEPDDIVHAHSLLGEDDAAVVCALQWEARLLELTDTLTPLHPPVGLLDRIHDTLGLPRPQIPSVQRAATGDSTVSTVGQSL